MHTIIHMTIMVIGQVKHMKIKMEMGILRHLMHILTRMEKQPAEHRQAVILMEITKRMIILIITETKPVIQ